MPVRILVLVWRAVWVLLPTQAPVWPVDSPVRRARVLVLVRVSALQPVVAWPVGLAPRLVSVMRSAAVWRQASAMRLAQARPAVSPVAWAER